MKKTHKGAATVAIATLLAGAVGIATDEAKAANILGTGADLRGALLRTAGGADELSAASPSPSPSPAPDGKKGGEGKCGEGKCGDSKK